MSGAKVMGYSRMDILGKHFQDLRIPEMAIISLMKSSEQVFSSGEIQTEEISLVQGKRNNQYLCSFSPLHATTGRINAVDIIFHDITNETRIAEELLQCRTQVNSLLGQGNTRTDNRK